MATTGPTVDNGALTDVPVAALDAGDGFWKQLAVLAYAAAGVPTPIPADVNGLLVKLAATVTVDGSGVTQPVAETVPGTAAVTSVAQNAASVSLLTALAGRRGFTIRNDAYADLYVKFGTTASASSHTVVIQPGGFFVFTYYKGDVDGIWAAAGSGAARITSLT